MDPVLLIGNNLKSCFFHLLGQKMLLMHLQYGPDRKPHLLYVSICGILEHFWQGANPVILYLCFECQPPVWHIWWKTSSYVAQR